ncbi:MAG TPA: acyl carrier protein [Myxococcales bacterium LLY-WYZ-16_1]|jgi:acyl carrier protein|nr:acyl carrier protein [Myxococcales bacterium LLY-WYZ-16_1]
MATQEEIIKLFKDSVREVDQSIVVDQVDAQTDLSSLGMDSVMTMEVIGILEERLDIRFPDEDLATLRTMSDLTQLVQRLL